MLEKLNEQLGSDDKDSRLFSTGLHGLLIEHDLDNIDKAINSDNRYVHDKQSVWSVTSGAAWCMSFNRRVNKLAIGTEEGESSVKVYYPLLVKHRTKHPFLKCYNIYFRVCFAISRRSSKCIRF